MIEQTEKMAASVKATVLDLKDSLSKEIQGESNTERCLDILGRLDECSISLQTLSETLVGVTVSKCKSNSDEVVSAKAKTLIKKWKKLAKKGGVATKNNNNSSADTLSGKKPAIPEETEKEWSQLPPLRKNMCVKMHETFRMAHASLVKGGFNAEAVTSLCFSRASELESVMFERTKGNRANYAEKARSLVFNLRKNKNLCDNVLLGATSPKELVSMSSSQMATAEKSKERAEIVEKIEDSRLLDWEQKNENKINEMCGITGDLLNASLFTCGRCKSIKTTSTQKQTRSADEPMTVFVLCLNCGKRWKC